MFWTVFVAAFLGALAASLILVGGLVIYDEQARRSKPSATSSDDLLEAYMQSHLVEHFGRYFPEGWSIYDDGSKPSGMAGIEYRFPRHRGRIDILALDENNQFVIIELKKGKAPDKVDAQVDRYITAVQQRLAERDQRVRAIIIANRYDSHFRDILKQRENIDFWQFEWQAKLIKRPRPIDA